MSGNPDSIEDGYPHVLGACTVQSHDQLSPLQAADGHVRYRVQLPSAADEPQQPRRQERAIVRLVRPLFCFDQLARARPATPCPAEAPRSLSARGHATPPRAARTPMCVVRQHRAARHSASSVGR